MAKTYVLNSTSVNDGKNVGWTSAAWGSYSNADGVRRVGMSGTKTYRAVNILFDQATLATLRTKTVTSIKLTLTVVSGNDIYANSKNYEIGYKLLASASSWTRGNANSTESSTTIAVGHVSRSTKISPNNTSLTIDLTGSKVPKYGYSIGPRTDSITSSNVLGSSATLTVVTDEVDEYTVTYNPGTGGSGEIVTDTKQEGETLTLRSVLFTKPGYTQNGWSTSDGGALAYDLGDEYSADANLTLYPTWEADQKTVYYKRGIYGSGTNVEDEKEYGVALTLRNALFTRAGYTQTGWATSDGGAKVYDFGDSYTDEEDIILYPSWQSDNPDVALKEIYLKVNGVMIPLLSWSGPISIYDDQNVLRNYVGDGEMIVYDSNGDEVSTIADDDAHIGTDLDVAGDLNVGGDLTVTGTLDAPGIVKSVDNKTPDASGNVSLELWKTLWTGSWSTGDITVPNLTDYKLFAVAIDGTTNYMLCTIGSDGTDFKGIAGHAYSATNDTMYSIKATINGNTLTMGNCHTWTAGSSSRTAKTITAIIGIL